MARHRLETSKKTTRRLVLVAALATTGLALGAAAAPAANAGDGPAIMSGHAFALSTAGLLKINPIADTGFISTTDTTTLNKCAVPLRVGTLLAARALCANVSSISGVGISAGASVGNVDVGLTGLPAIQLRSVSAASGTGCGGSNGNTEIGFLKVGTKILIPNLVKPAPNTIINVAGIKLILNEQIQGLASLTVNAVVISVGATQNVVIASATTSINNC